MEQKRILVLGASSYLGNLFMREQTSKKVLGTFNRNKVDLSIHFNSYKDDISQLEINWKEFSHAVILIGDTDPDSCYGNSRLSNLINVESIKKVIDFLVLQNIFVIFTSTEFVFDGSQGMYKELDIVKPILLYGEQKLEIESYLQDVNQSCILRLSKMYGDSKNDGTLFNNWLEALKQDKKIYCANDQYFSPVYVQDVIKVIELVIRNNITGLYHVSCGKRYRRDRLLGMLCQILNYEPSINYCSINDFDLPESRPLDVSLDSSNITSLLKFTFTDPEDFINNRLINQANRL